MQKNNQDGANHPASSGQTPVSATHTVLTANQIQVLSNLRGQQNAIGLLRAGSGTSSHNIIALPRVVSAPSSVTQALHVSGTPIANSRLISPQTINIIQRQLSASGIVGLSPVNTQNVQQVLQVSGTPLTLVKATNPDTVTVLDSDRKIQILQRNRDQQLPSGSTIHHLGQKSPAKPASNLNVSCVANMSNNVSQTSVLPGIGTVSSTSSPNSSAISVSSLKDMKLTSSAHSFSLVTGSSSAIGTARAATSPPGGPLPKKIKLDEKPPLSVEITSLRQNVMSHKYKKMREIKGRYRNHLTELFYLQDGGNMMELNAWKKRPTPALLNFLEGSKLPSNDDEELQEMRINDEVKVLTSAGSNIPIATPVAISTTLPPSVSALSQQAMNSATTTTSSLINAPLTTAASSELQQHLSRATDTKSVHGAKGNASSNQHIAAKTIKSQNNSPGRSRQAIAAVYENVTGSQDVIERAKQEAKVLQRVNELRREGLWTAKRLPRVQEPPRQKAHWDYLLEEMTWLAADFIQERKWKKAAAKKIARMVSNYFKEREMKELKAEKEEAIKLKKISSQMAKMVKEFWNNIEKVVQYKQTTRLEEKKKKALDLHLSFIVDQTEKYSSWLTAGLQNANSSKASSVMAADEVLDAADAEFQPMETASDDEETIEKEEIEAGDDDDATKKEIEALQKESELPLEEVLKGLPKEMLEEPSSQLSFDGEGEEDPLKIEGKKKDQDYTVSDEEAEDEEETLEEQETQEKDYSNELNDLKEEGEMTVEELMKKYEGAYDSDFELPEEESSEDESNGEESSEEESENESEEAEETGDVNADDKEDNTEDSKKGMGLEYLVEKEKETPPPSEPNESKTEEGPGREFNDIAAAAQSLQPKGYTLETTEVKTKVPFLLKHTLREYQHVGLDWLATMNEKRLNGILADEMGLGKTIQTIALLAHLACEKGIWGPHLIVVPTSVMLNWEMEIKKWCPAFKILTYYGTIKERKLKRQGWTKTNAFHVCITSYKLVVQDHQAFRRKKWKYFILDEAQNIKNFKSQRWQMLLNFSSQRRLLLTGTPLQNSLMELWSLMHFLMPNVFQSHSEFKEWFSNPLTGMIEGSKEYNESLVRRLHKVLRPFLLRRLKNEVEKQMPQKYEHVVMCRLSKRQRFLYDDFMGQTKTRDTLAGGHFMSVINILMQLRKVCNHPNLFDPRPIISPFKMEGIVYNTSSLVSRALEYDPFKDINLYSLYPNLSEMETDLPAFVAQRVKQLKAPGKLIEEVDSMDPPEPRPPSGQLKNLRNLSAAAAVAASQQVDTSQPKAAAVNSSKSSSPSVQTTQSSSVNSIKLLLPSSSSSSTPQSILIPNPSGSGPSIVLPLPASSSATTSSSVSSTSAALAQAKLISSQLQSGVLQLVQTSKGHQVITAASTSNSSSSSTPTSVSPSVSLLKVLPQQKPVMKVSPFVVSSGNDTSSSNNSALNDTKGSNAVMTKSSNTPPAKGQKPVKRSELFLESLYRKKEERRKHVLSHLAKISKQRCSTTPTMGPDTHHCVNCFRELSPANSVSSSRKAPEHIKCLRHGYGNCLFAQDKSINHFHPDVFWRETSHLIKSVRSPDDHLAELKEILCRFVFVTPTVICPSIQMHVSHPDPHSRSKLNRLESNLRPFIRERSEALHPIMSRTVVQFPEPRLIQYDCGKLQTLDRLLRQLKTGHHRVLIFTQMTKMLDVLEAFLNFHGHRYLRLDGTTKVEQRQYLMDRFNADARIFCFILSTRSGGVGVNLTGADTVVFYDSDWNPTMDAQAQDRCHRIGQTRDVHIYRLVSEMTVEENILKKANQKRLLGDLAIEGGNFTTAFFKEQTISDLFAEPSGLESLVEEKAARAAAKSQPVPESTEKEAPPQPQPPPPPPPPTKDSKKDTAKKESAILSQFEQALSKAEDETDAQAIKQVTAEQKAELAEFDESIPWDEREAEQKKDEDEEEMSRVEMELAMLDKELTPIERYAVTVMESQTEPETAEELKMAEEDIQNSKKDWELARLKALKEEEERKAELEEDEMLYIYSKDESQMFISELGGEEMPMWCPPTPPQDDNDIYMDDSLHFLYEAHTMPEQSLPPIYIPKAHKKPKLETVTTRKQKQRKEEQPRVPRSLFDKPKEVVNKQRKEAKMQRLRQNLQVPVPKMLAGRSPLGQHQQQPQPAIVAKPEPDPNYPEWLVHEEWALLEAVQHIQKLSPDLLVDNPAQIVNWDFVSDYVSVVGRIFRAPKHCRYQYEYVVLPREDGRIMLNIKQKKSPKSIYKTKNTRPLRTEQLYSQDGLKNLSHLYNIRFGSMMDIGAKRPTATHQTIVNPAAKPAKHASILADNDINYDSPMLPSQLAARRAERIAMDKKKQQAQQQAQAASASAAAAQDQAVAQRTLQAGLVASGVTPTIQGAQLSSIVSVTSNTVIPGQVPKVAVGTGLTAVSIARTIGASNIIVNTGLQSGPFAAINKRMSQAALPNTVAVSGNISSVVRGQRTAVPGTTAITLQEVGSVAGTPNTMTVAAQAARSTLQSSVASPSLPAGLLANQKLAISPANLQSQLVRGNLTPQQINILRQSQSSIVRAQVAGGAQQFRAQKLLATPEQIRAQQLGKHPQKVITQQLLVPVRGGQSILQGTKPGLLRTTTIPSDQLHQALKMRTQIQTPTGKQLQTAQIIQGQVTAVGQTAASTSQTPVALVKSVSASASSSVPVTIPVSSINVGQQRTVVASRAATQIHPHHMLLQQRKAGGQQKVSGLNTSKTGQIPLLIPQNSKLNTVLTSNQILHQIGVVNRPAGAIQQIITHSSQPTIITQVSQTGGQPITQMVAKVSLTSGGQTITPGTPITVTHVSSTGQGLNLGGKSAVKTATITSLEGGPSTVQVTPVQKGLAGLTQSLVTPQSIQVQQANTPSTPSSQFLQVSLASTPSATTSSQVPAITIPASFVPRTATTLPASTPQISFVSPPNPVPSVSTIAAVQVQQNPSPATVEAPTTNQVIAHNVPAPAAMATVVTQTTQADASQQGAAGTKASPYTMRTRNTKH